MTQTNAQINKEYEDYNWIDIKDQLPTVSDGDDYGTIMAVLNNPQQDKRIFNFETVAKHARSFIKWAPMRPSGKAQWVVHECAEEFENRLIPNYECPRCHSWFRDKTNFCPDCGLKMKN